MLSYLTAYIVKFKFLLLRSIYGMFNMVSLTPCSNRTLFKFFVGGSICIFLVIQSTGGYRAKVGVFEKLMSLFTH